MDSLPLTVIYGEHLWLGLVAFAVLLHLIVSAFLPRLTAGFRARRQRARLGEPVALETVQEGQSVTLTGTLRVGDTPAKRFEDEGDAALTTASPHRPAEVLGALAISRLGEGVVLEVGGIPVDVEGEIEVLLGSREVFLRSRFARLGGSVRAALDTPDELAFDALQRHRVAFRSLVDGDAARLRGYIRRQSSSDAAEGYRVAGDRWVLTSRPDADDSGGEEWTVAAATEGTPRSALPGVAWLMRKLVVSVVLWLAVVGVVGYFASNTILQSGGVIQAPYRDLPRGYCTDGGIGALTHLAFILPFRYSEELLSLANSLESGCEWDRQRVEQIAGAHLLRGRPQEAMGVYLRHGAINEAESLARSFDLQSSPPEAAVDGTLFALGFYDDLSQRAVAGGERRWFDSTMVDADADATTHLLAGNVDAAISAARRRGHTQDGAPYRAVATAPPQKSWNVPDWNFACLADVLDGGRIDAGAPERLRAHAVFGRRQTACPLLLASTLSGEERRVALREITRSYTQPNRWEALLLLAVDDPDELGNARTSFIGRALHRTPCQSLRGASADTYTGLEAAALEALEGRDALGERPTVVRASLRARAALFEMTLGQYEAAIPLARGVVEDLERLDPLAHRDAMRFGWYQLALGRLAVVARLAGDDAAVAHAIERLRTTASVGQNVPPLTEVLALEELVEPNSISEGNSGLCFGIFHDWPQWDGLQWDDGRQIAPLLWGLSPMLRESYIPFWIAGVRDHREYLASQARWGMRERRSGRFDLFASLRRHGWALSAARAFGDEEWAAEVEPVVERLRRAHLRRDTALWLHITEMR